MHAWSPSARSADGDGIALLRYYGGFKRIQHMNGSYNATCTGEVSSTRRNLTTGFVVMRVCCDAVLMFLNTKTSAVYWCLCGCVGRRGIMLTGVGEP